MQEIYLSGMLIKDLIKSLAKKSSNYYIKRFKDLPLVYSIKVNSLLQMLYKIFMTFIHSLLMYQKYKDLFQENYK